MILDPWELIKAGQYEHAVDAYTDRSRTEELAPDYGNRGIAHVNLGLLERAQLDFKAADQCSLRASGLRGSAHVEWIGTAQWLAGEERLAAETWHKLAVANEAGEIAYNDAAGGVGCACLLYFAATSLGDDALLDAANRLLGKLSRRRAIKAWPGPIALLLLGRISGDDIAKQVSTVRILRERQLCQTHFYCGVQARQRGNAAAGIQSWEAAAALKEAILEREYYLANHELRRLERSRSA